MTRALALVALHAASAAIKRAHDTCLAAGLTESANHLHQAGQLVLNAVGLVIVDKAREMRAEERTS